jgi:hypothetical protein
MLKESATQQNSLWISRIETTLLIFVVSFGYAMLMIGAWHTVPTAEDYELSCASRDLGIIHSILEIMTNYDGRYSTNFLQAINPLVFNCIRGYSWMNFLGIVLLNLSLYFFMRLILKSKNQFSTFLYSALITVVFMGSILCFATFYQMTGSFVYLYCNSFVLFFVSCLILYLKAQTPLSENIYFAFTAFVLFAAIGFSELYLPFYSLLLTLILLYAWHKNYHLLKKFLPVYFIGIMSIVFFVATPGVAIHINQSQSIHSGSSIVEVLLNGLDNYGSTLYTTIKQPIFYCSLIYLTLQFHDKTIEQKVKISRTVILLLTVLTIVVTLLMSLSYYLPKMDAVGYPLKIYTPILFLLFVTSFVFISGSLEIPRLFSTSYTITSLKFLLLTIVLISFIRGENYIASLYSDYRNGKLQTFKKFMDNRVDLLTKASQAKATYKTVYVPGLLDYPRSVYTSIDSETVRKNSKWHKFHEEYFRIDEITTIGDTTLRF